ncbi:MAG: DedA family protein [Epsilonproteobacteria bacterium]|nr:MAG: DedA family protein [Campylobacterota bacterium]
MNYLYLFLISFISATLFPLGSEALLLYNLTLDLNIYLLFFFATFGNSLGSVVNYWIGLKGEEYLIDKKVLNEKSILKSKKYFDKYGGYSLLFSWVPIIGDPITFIAGVLKYNIKKFILLVILAKGGRYLFLIISYKLYTIS